MSLVEEIGNNAEWRHPQLVVQPECRDVARSSVLSPRIVVDPRKATHVGAASSEGNVA